MNKKVIRKINLSYTFTIDQTIEIFDESAIIPFLYEGNAEKIKKAIKRELSSGSTYLNNDNSKFNSVVDIDFKGSITRDVNIVDNNGGTDERKVNS